MHSAGVHPLLTKEGEGYLFGLINSSEDERTVEWARKKVMESNLRLVISIAKRYPVSSKYDFIDLIGVGNIGLEHSIDLFKVEKGFKFSTYATFWIRQKIGRYIDTNTLDVKADQGEVAVARKLDVLLEASSLDQNSPITLIAEALGVSVVSAERIVGMRRQGIAVRLDKEIGEDGETSLGDLISFANDEFVEIIMNEDLSERFLDILQHSLDTEEFELLLYRMGYTSEDGKRVSYRALGERYGETSPEWMRRRTVKIIEKVRNYIQKNHPDLQTLMG
jgi:RNA polymerase primary sigma factor